MTWAKLKAAARRLTDAQLFQHSYLDLRNPRHCRSCFSCACFVVQRERKLVT